MKRPFATIGFTCFAVLFIVALTERNDVTFFLLVSSLVLGFLCLFKKNSRQAQAVTVCLFTAAFACLLFWNSSLERSRVQSLAGNDVRVEATVSEAPYMKKETGRHYCVLKLESVDGKRVKGKLRLSFSVKKDGIETDYLQTDNRVSFNARIYLPGEDEKSISRYFTAENILLGAYSAKDFSYSRPVQRGINYYFQQIRSFISQRLRHGFSDSTAGVLAGLLIGDKSFLDDDIYDAFRLSGAAHLMAVSGLHLSIWVFFFGSLIPEGNGASRLKYLLLMLLVIFVMFISGMSESVKRAGFMSLVFLFGKLSKRRSDSLNSLGLSVLIMLIYNPACVMSISLQLSFLSTLGILTLGKLLLKRFDEILGTIKIKGAYKRLVKAGLSSFGISLSVLIFTAPVVICNFGGISTVTAWVNMLISPLVTPLVVLSGLYAALSFLPFASYPVALAVRALSQVVIFTAKSFSGFKNAFLTFEADNVLLFIVAVIVIFLICFIVLKKRGEGKLALTVFTVVACAILVFSHERLNTENIKLHLSNYGEVSALAATIGENAVIIGEIPTYEKNIFIQSLKEKSIKSFYQLSGEGELILQDLDDGKIIFKGNELKLNDDIRIYRNESAVTMELFKKYLCVFSSEPLQYEYSCDIITEMLDSGDTRVVLNGYEKAFSLNEEKGLVLTLENDGNLIVRGEDSWRNLMKNS